MDEHTVDEILTWSIDAYGKAEDLTLRQQKLPVPTGGQVLIRVQATSLNPVDLKLVGGEMAEFMPITFPFTPGGDACGDVVAVGPEVQGFSIGDRVVGMTTEHGAMASHVICNGDGPLVKIPASASSTTMAALPEAGMTALFTVHASGMKQGMTVAVLGATGGVGLILCQVAARLGAHVIATASGEDDEQLVRANGAAATLDYRKHNAVEALLAIEPGGVDLVIDLIAQGDALLASAKGVRKGGTLLSTLMGPEQSAFGEDVAVSYIRLVPTPELLHELVTAVQDGWLNPNISKLFPFAQVPEAYTELRDGHVRGKIVIEVK